jgi:hypothetical protein
MVALDQASEVKIEFSRAMIAARSVGAARRSCQVTG